LTVLWGIMPMSKINELEATVTHALHLSSVIHLIVVSRRSVGLRRQSILQAKFFAALFLSSTSACIIDCSGFSIVFIIFKVFLKVAPNRSLYQV